MPAVIWIILKSFQGKRISVGTGAAATPGPNPSCPESPCPVTKTWPWGSPYAWQRVISLKMIYDSVLPTMSVRRRVWLLPQAICKHLLPERPLHILIGTAQVWPLKSECPIKMIVISSELYSNGRTHIHLIGCSDYLHTWKHNRFQWQIQSVHSQQKPWQSIMHMSSLVHRQTINDIIYSQPVRLFQPEGEWMVLYFEVEHCLHDRYCPADQTDQHPKSIFA